MFCVSKLTLLCYFKLLICVLLQCFGVDNCFYTTAKLVKCCICVCYVPIKASYLLTYSLTYLLIYLQLAYNHFIVVFVGWHAYGGRGTHGPLEFWYVSGLSSIFHTLKFSGATDYHHHHHQSIKHLLINQSINQSINQLLWRLESTQQNDNKQEQLLRVNWTQSDVSLHWLQRKHRNIITIQHSKTTKLSEVLMQLDVFWWTEL